MQQFAIAMTKLIILSKSAASDTALGRGDKSNLPDKGTQCREKKDKSCKQASGYRDG
jgi:hypothetical protein